MQESASSQQLMEHLSSVTCGAVGSSRMGPAFETLERCPRYKCSVATRLTYANTCIDADCNHADLRPPTSVSASQLSQEVSRGVTSYMCGLVSGGVC